MTLQFCKQNIYHNSMVVILLLSPLQPQSDTKVVPDKKAILMTGGFLLADSMLKGITNKK